LGSYIVEYEQHGNEKAECGSSLLTNLSKDLKSRFGKGFSKSNIYLTRQFYIKYQIFQSVTGKLIWTHYVELLGVSDDIARGFYEKPAVNDNWSVRELKRQINSSLFERLALSQDKRGDLKLSEKGLVISEPKDIIKDLDIPVILTPKSPSHVPHKSCLCNHIIRFQNAGGAAWCSNYLHFNARYFIH